VLQYFYKCGSHLYEFNFVLLQYSYKCGSHPYGRRTGVGRGKVFKKSPKLHLPKSVSPSLAHSKPHNLPIIYKYINIPILNRNNRYVNNKSVNNKSVNNK